MTIIPEKTAKNGNEKYVKLINIQIIQVAGDYL